MVLNIVILVDFLGFPKDDWMINFSVSGDGDEAEQDLQSARHPLPGDLG